MTLPSRFPITRPIFALAVVAALLGCLTVPPQAAAQSTSQNTRLQPMVNALATQLQLAFRDDPIEYDLRYMQLSDAVTAWNESAKKPADRAAMTAWFHAAIRASMPGSVGPMPEVPALDGKPAIDQQLPPPLEWVEPAEAEDESEPKAATSESAKPTPLPEFELPAITPVVEPAAPAATEKSPAAPVEKPTTPEATVESPVAPTEEPAAPAEGTESLLGPVEQPANTELEFPFGDDEPQPTTPEPSQPAEQPAVEEPKSEEPADAEPATETPADEKTSVEEPAEVKLSTDSPPPVEEDSSTEEPADNKSSESDLFGESSGDPFQDDPESDDAPAEEEEDDEPAEAEETKETDAAKLDPEVQPASHQPAVNLSEFRARAEGYDRGLGELEAELLENEEPIDDQFVEYSHTLDGLLSEHEFLELYFQGLSEAERAEVTAPKSADAVIKLLNTRLTTAGKPEFERSTERGSGSE